MSTVILDATKSNNDTSNALVEVIKKKGTEYTLFKLEDMKIVPCRSCGACAFKSPGRCVFSDDMHDILKAVAKCSEIIMITPVRFGGYSSTLKKAVDKFMNLGIPTYKLMHGRLVHPGRYGTKTLTVVGIYEGDPVEQSVSFNKLVEHNAFNMQYRYRTVLVKESDASSAWIHKLDDINEKVAL